MVGVIATADPGELNIEFRCLLFDQGRDGDKQIDAFAGLDGTSPEHQQGLRGELTQEGFCCVAVLLFVCFAVTGCCV